MLRPTGLVDGAVSASEAALGAYVAALVEAQLAAARERIREYGDRWELLLCRCAVVPLYRCAARLGACGSHPQALSV